MLYCNNVNEQHKCLLSPFALCIVDTVQIIFMIVNRQLICLCAYSYRLAPDAVFPAAFEDCVKATKYFLKNAAEFHIDPHRVAVFGKMCHILSMQVEKTLLLVFSLCPSALK